MPTYPLFGSTKLDPALETEVPPQLSVGDEVSRGFRRGLRGAGGSLAQLAGLGAEALGAPEVAQTAYGAAKSLRESAMVPELAPGVATFDDVNGLGSGLRWAAGKAGELVPILGTALAGGALTANPLVGGTVAMAPFEMGDIAERQDQTLPAGERLRNAALGGAASAVVGNIGPARLARKWSGGLRENLPTAVITNAGGAAGSEGIKQVAAEQPFNPEALGEAAVAGGVLGGAVHLPASVIGGVRNVGGKAADLAGKGIDLAKSKTKEGIDLAADSSAGKTASDVWGKMVDLGERVKTKADTTAEDILQGRPIGEAAKDFATAAGDRAKELWEMSNKEKGEWAKKATTDILDDLGFNEEKRAAVAEAASKIGDRAAEITIAGAHKARAAAQKTKGKLEQLNDALEEQLKERAAHSRAKDLKSRLDNPDITDVESKRSADYSGPEKSILLALRESGLVKRRPDLFDHQDNIDLLGRVLRKTLIELNERQLSDKTVKRLVGLLGDDTMPVLSTIHRAVHDKSTVAKFLKNVSEIDDIKKSTDDLHKQLKGMFTPEALENYNSGAFNLAELEDAFVHDLRNTGSNNIETQAIQKASDKVYKRVFGPKADAARKIFEKLHKRQTETFADPTKYKKPADRAEAKDPLGEGGVELESSEGGFDENGQRLEPEEMDRVEFGLDATRKDGGKRRKVGGRRYDVGDEAKQEQHLMDVRADYPGYNVYFDKEAGRIVAERPAAEVRIGAVERESMRFDRGYKPGPTTVEIGGEKYDAVKITRNTLKRKEAKNEDDGLPNAVRQARAFFEGSARLIDAAETEGVNIPDTTIIGYVGSKPLTFAHAKRLTADTAEDRMSVGSKKELETLRQIYKEKGDSPALRERVEALLERTKNEELANGLDTQERNPPRPTNYRKRAGGLPADQAGPREPISRADGYEPSRADRQERKRQAQYNRGEDIDAYSEVSANRAFDDEGNLTKAGLEDILGGGAHGGINVRDQGNRRDRPRRTYKGEHELADEDGQQRLDFRGGRVRQQNRDLQDAADTEFRSYFKAKGEGEPGMGRTELMRDENIHMAAASGEDISVRTNADGSSRTLGRPSKAANKLANELIDMADEWRLGSTSEPVRRLAARAETLAKNINVVSEADMRKLAAVADKTPSEAAAVLNEMARKYAGAIATPGRSVGELPKDWDTKRATTVRTDSGKAPDFAPGAKRLAAIRKEESPNPKEVAAKKAALVERAASGDPKLIEELRSTDDAKGLQRAIEALNEGFRLTVRGPYTAKDQAKAARATAYIGRGSERSSTALYARDAAKQGIPVNKGEYTNKDVVFVSAEGARQDRLSPDFAEIKKATDAGATILTDDAANRGRGYNVGERQVEQKLLEANYSEVEPGVWKPDAVKTANARMSELIKDEDTAYGMLTRKYSLSDQKIDPNATGPVNRAAVEQHIKDVLGNSVRVFWPQFSAMKWAGDYTHVQKLIRVSVHALNPMSIAHHESMHAFLAQLRDMGAHDIVKMMENVAESPHMRKQLDDFLKSEPDALLQLKDKEERVAYLYQMWAAGVLKPTPVASTLFGKITAFLRKITGVWTNEERALEVMKYFNTGEYAKAMSNPSAVARALNKIGTNRVYEQVRGLTEPLAGLAERLFSMGSARVRETGVPSLRDIADAVKLEDTDASGKDRGFIRASRIQATKMRSRFVDLLGDLKQEHFDDALDALQNEKPATTREGRMLVFNIKQTLKNTRQYMIDAGLDVGDLGPDYFPRVWDTAYIMAHQKEFRDMLEPYIRSKQFTGDVDRLVNNLVARSGTEDFRETLMPGMQFMKHRDLAFIKATDAAPFLQKDLLHTMDSYLTQAARRAEWHRRFGNGKLERKIAQAKKEGATQEMIDTTLKWMQGVDGTLGDDINPGLRRLEGNTIVYQNVRLLPLAVFSSVVDPMGIIVRGGTVGDAWKTFVKGFKDMKRYAVGGGKKQWDEAMAETLGVIDNAMLSHITSELYTQGMVGGTAQKINNAFFKYNLMEGLNRSYRVGATQAALKFLERHADGTFNRHSKRWIEELGLQAGDIQYDKLLQRIKLSKFEGLTDEQEVRIHSAINQWVDGAVLRPDAADKPIWMNDPHYAVFAHLKQFIYSFQKTIIERVIHEAKHQNYTPAMALASYVPVMIASDYIKGMIQGGGEQPDWKAGWGPAEYIGYGVQRAGLLGVGQFGVDAYESIKHGGLGVTALAGPTVEQISDVLGAMGGREQFGKVALEAMPANALYSEAMGPTHTH